MEELNRKQEVVLVLMYHIEQLEKYGLVIASGASLTDEGRKCARQLLDDGFTVTDEERIAFVRSMEVSGGM